MYKTKGDQGGKERMQRQREADRDIHREVERERQTRKTGTEREGDRER